MGQYSWLYVSRKREAGRCLLSVGQGLLPGTKAENCEGKSDTKKRGNFFPNCGHTPKGEAHQPWGEGGGKQRGLQVPVQAAGSRKESVLVLPVRGCGQAGGGPEAAPVWPDPNL